MLEPRNKWLVLEGIADADKIGSIIVPGNAGNQYPKAKITALPPECVETTGLTIGDVVVYDSLGAVNIRVGDRSYTVVKALNVMGVIK